MSHHRSKKTIFLAPAPRTVPEIFDDNDLTRLRAIADVVVPDEGHVTETLFDEHAGSAEIIIGQIDLPESRLRRVPSLKAVFNVEGNFLPNIDYNYCFSNGIRVLNVSPVFAEPVAEAALGMAIDLARGISRSDRNFRQGTEEYGLAANREAFSLYRAEVGLVGLGDLGRAILPLLRPFGCRVRAHDPWLPAEYIQSLGCEAVSLDDVFCCSRLVFIVAGVTSQNEGSLGAQQLASMQPGSAVVLVSRAGIVDFDAMLDFANRGHIRFATDVYPQEPLPPAHPARFAANSVLCAHQAGAMQAALRRIGKLVVADTELILKGLAPILCKVAQPETVTLSRSKPVTKS
jgi:phosphoglycerate dehydrogenase-like enzyme